MIFDVTGKLTHAKAMDALHERFRQPIISLSCLLLICICVLIASSGAAQSNESLCDFPDERFGKRHSDVVRHPVRLDATITWLTRCIADLHEI